MLALGDALSLSVSKKKVFQLKNLENYILEEILVLNLLKLKKECIKHQKFPYQIKKQV